MSLSLELMSLHASKWREISKWSHGFPALWRSTGAVNCRRSQQGYNLTIALGTVTFPFQVPCPKKTSYTLYWIRNFQTQNFTVWEFRFLSSCHNSHKNTVKYSCLYVSHVRGRNSAVSIATRYGVDGPGIESRWGRNFPHLSRLALGPTQPPKQWVPGLSRE
jgi:hypothetical protein